MKFKHYIMEDVLESLIDYRGKTPHKSEFGIKTLSAKSVKDGYIDYDQCYCISQDEYKRFMTRGIPQKGDVLLTTEAPLGVTSRLDRDDVAIAQRLLTLRGKSGVLDTGYLYYYLKSPMGQRKLRERETGTTVAGIKQSEFRKIEIDIPDLQVQKKISKFLETLDQKVNVNRRINKNLQVQAQAIYTKMFITDADSSWPEGKLSDLIEVCYGKDHKKLNDGDIPVYGSGGIMRHVDQSLYDQESVLIPRKGTLNNVMYVNEPFWSVDTMFYTKMKRPNVAKFVFHFIKGKDLASMNAGSAVPSMTTKILDAIPLQIPDDQTLSNFETQVSPYYEAITCNNTESENLATLRDVLLPKLMSGEIDVSDIDL